MKASSEFSNVLATVKELASSVAGAARIPELSRKLSTNLDDVNLQDLRPDSRQEMEELSSAVDEIEQSTKAIEQEETSIPETLNALQASDNYRKLVTANLQLLLDESYQSQLEVKNAKFPDSLIDFDQLYKPSTDLAHALALKAINKKQPWHAKFTGAGKGPDAQAQFSILFRTMALGYKNRSAFGELSKDNKEKLVKAINADKSTLDQEAAIEAYLLDHTLINDHKEAQRQTQGKQVLPRREHTINFIKSRITALKLISDLKIKAEEGDLDIEVIEKLFAEQFTTKSLAELDDFFGSYVDSNGVIKFNDLRAALNLDSLEAKLSQEKLDSFNEFLADNNAAG